MTATRSATPASLEQRRAALQARSREQRQVLTAEFGQLRNAAEIVDKGWGLFGRLRKKPLWIAAAAATLIVLKSGRLLSVLKTCVFGWQTFKLIQSLRTRARGG